MDTTKIIELLASGKKVEAKKKLADFLENVKISPEEEIRVYQELSSLFIKVNSDILRDYKEILEVVSEEFRDLNLKEKIIAPPGAK